MSSARSLKPRKKIAFAIGTAPPKVVRIAISISRHETVEQIGVTTYFIDILHSGRVTVVKRRYKDFEILNKTLIIEVGHLGFCLPPLPQKRWFQTQRWLNRYDAAYIDDRRYGLEVYLRGLLRLPGIIDNCPSLRNFLNITALASEDPYALERDAFDAIKHEYTYVYEAEPEEGEDWPPINRSRNSPIKAEANSLSLSGGSSNKTSSNGNKTVVTSNNVSTSSAGGGRTSETSASATAISSSSTVALQSIGSDSDDSDQELDSDDDKAFTSRRSRIQQEGGAKKSGSKFSSVFIDGRERSGSAGSSHSGLMSSSPPLDPSHFQDAVENGNGAFGRSSHTMKDYCEGDDEDVGHPEDPNDVWALSISSAAHAGLLLGSVESTPQSPPTASNSPPSEVALPPAVP